MKLCPQNGISTKVKRLSKFSGVSHAKTEESSVLTAEANFNYLLEWEDTEVRLMVKGTISFEDSFAANECILSRIDNKHEILQTKSHFLVRRGRSVPMVGFLTANFAGLPCTHCTKLSTLQVLSSEVISASETRTFRCFAGELAFRQIVQSVHGIDRHVHVHVKFCPSARQK